MRLAAIELVAANLAELPSGPAAVVQRIATIGPSCTNDS